MSAMLMAAAIAANPIQVLDDYRNCTINRTVQLGSSNAETADTIIRAVRSICKPQWDNLQKAAGVGLGVRTIDETVLNWRTDAENAAIAALLEARSKR